MNRSLFIKNTVLGSSALLLSKPVFSKNRLSSLKSKKLTILHTNDTHSNIDAFPDNHAKYPGLGGISKRYALIQKIRKEEENVLLLDAGDVFQGTPYFNTFKGVLEMKLMSKLGYDACTMGNHDFDAGLEGFFKAKKYANFPFLCSNYDFSQTILNNSTQKHTIIKRGGIKIGIFGIGVELAGLVPKDKYGNSKYLDPIECANREALILKEKKCDLIICLSHLGYEQKGEKISDLKLAKYTENIHLIIGGHTHTFLKKPTIVKNKQNEAVLINQVGWAGVNLGRIDIEIESGFFSGKPLEIR